MIQRGIPQVPLSTDDDVVATLQAKFGSRRKPSAAHGSAA
jgi:hypothetical protein